MQIFDSLSNRKRSKHVERLFLSPRKSVELYWAIEIDVMIEVMARLGCGGDDCPKNTISTQITEKLVTTWL
jgi:hypothetical protein